MDTDIVAPMIVLTVLTISIASVAILLRGPVGRALGRRLESTSAADQDLVQRVEELETRLLAAEQVEGRLADVEERLDFAERFLASEKKAAQIPGER